MTTQLSKQDYLKKYLSNGEKKKKKKKAAQGSIIKSRIIDDDIDLKNMRVVNSDELEIYDLAEEAPQIAGFVDERPEDVKLMSEFRTTKKWKIITDELGVEDVKVVAIEDNLSKETQNDSNCEKSEAPPLEGTDSKTIDDRLSSNKKNMDSDYSPPRKGRRDSNSDASPPRRIKRERSDSDTSPPRKSKKHASDSSPRRCWRNKSYDRDLSPPRKSKKRLDTHQSPLRRIKGEKSDSDVSPPRRSRKNHDVNHSPSRKVKNEHLSRKYESDLSPPRRKVKNETDSDSSYKKWGDNKEKISRRKNRFSMKSIDKKRTSKSPELDYHRHASERSRRKSSEIDSKDMKKRGSSPRGSKSKNTLSGKKSGLQNAEELRKEIEEMKRRQKEADSSLQGKNEAVVVRDRKTGLRIDPKEEARKRREKEEKEAEKLAQYAVWGKGVKQVQDNQDKLKEDLYEMSKPLARYADDKDLDDMLKNKEWEGDPMLEYIRKKRKKKEAAISKPEYKGSFMPNRYGIKPGYRWDGVDRSNGYEKKWFEEQNARKAREEEAFKWSTADM